MNDQRLKNVSTQFRHALLDAYYDDIEAIILQRQDPISGLLPASTAVTAHGDYTHAWVRDNVYSILAVWGLALAYRRAGDDNGRAYALEQSVVKLMRGLLTAMMKQAPKVERFKTTLNPLDALHAKYDTRSGDPVVDDAAWGHLQLDATALYCLMLAQMTASGLRIVFTLDEVAFVQNLVHYLGQAYHTPDFGIWERGHKMNEGRAEINASSVGMAKAALEALAGLDLFGRHGGPASAIYVPADDIAKARATLAALLPRESESKETDAALLSIIGFPAFAVEDAALAERTRNDIIAKLQGHYGCKRFLRDGHQTVLENHGRLHYETGELARFEHIESEWPLFFTYLLLDGALRNDRKQAADYRERLDALCIERDGRRLLPELYYVPAENIEAEKAAPGSQARLANENLPLVWAQSLYLLGRLIQDHLLTPADLDPLGRRLRPGCRPAVRVQVALLAEDEKVQARLAEHGIRTQTLAEIRPVQVRQARQLVDALTSLGENRALQLTGRPARRLGALMTSQVFTVNSGATCLFLPPCLKPMDFYLHLDNHLLARQLSAELTYIHNHWEQPGKPLLTVLLTEPMLQAMDNRSLLVLLNELQNGEHNGVTVRTGALQDLLPTASRARLGWLRELDFQDPPLPERDPSAVVLHSSQAVPVPAATASAWRREPDPAVLQLHLTASSNPYAQIELLGLLWERLGAEADSACGGTVRQTVETVYRRARRARLWRVIRHAAGLLDLVDDALEDAVADIVIRQHQLSVGRTYASEAVLVRPLGNQEIMERVHCYGGADPLGRALIQEIILFLGMLVKTDPNRFRGVLTLRPWHLLLLLAATVVRERGVTQGEAFELLLALSPYAILERLAQLDVDADVTRWYHTRAESYRQPGGFSPLQQVRFSAADDPAGVHDWTEWRETNGALSRLPDDFYPRVRALLRQCKGLVIGDPLDIRNRLDSALMLADTTPAEKGFALRVEHLLNNIQAPEYRQLSIETLWALSAVAGANPGLKVNDDIVVDALIDTAVHRCWREAHPHLEETYNEHCAEAWRMFYAEPPHRVADAIMAAALELLDAAEHEVLVAA